jgi:CBS domain-containing protein
MTPAPQCVLEDDTLTEAARLMRDLDVGALPVCRYGRKLKGMVTDRDIVVKCIAGGGDPSTATAGSLVAGVPVTVDADEDAYFVLEAMKSNQIRRVPVIADDDLVGIISQGDIAVLLAPHYAGQTVAEISAAVR